MSGRDQHQTGSLEIKREEKDRKVSPRMKGLAENKREREKEGRSRPKETKETNDKRSKN
jgi:hypothetical protein